MAQGPLDDLRKQIARRQVLAIVGTGVSIATTGGQPTATVGGKAYAWASWVGLLYDGVEKCEKWGKVRPDEAETLRGKIGTFQTDKMIEAAAVIEQCLETNGLFKQWLRESVGALSPKHRGVIEALHALDVPLATTNYDGLISAVITDLPPVTWLQENQIEGVVRGDQRAVLHLHGHWEQSESVVLGQVSYDRVRNHPNAQAMLRALRATRTWLFIGVGDGLGDPNFGALLEWSRGVFQHSEYHHYRLALASEVEEHQKKHHPHEGIHALSFGDKHADLEGFLRDLAPKRRPKRKPLPKGKPACFGRDAEINDLVRTLLLSKPPPTPIMGPPGIGKSTVALVALLDKKVRKRYNERCCFVRCDACQTRGAVIGEIALAMKVEPSAQLEESVFAELGRARTVLVLDNAETPWWADPKGIEELLAALADLPGVALVATIRSGDRPWGTSWRDTIALEKLEPNPAREAFLKIAGAKHGADCHLDDLLGAVERVPLAIVLLAHQADGEANLERLWKRWNKERTELLRRAEAGTGDRLTNFDLSIELSITSPRMTDDARRLLALLGLLPDGIAPDDLDALLPDRGDRAARALVQVGLAFEAAARLRVLAPIREYVARHHPPIEDDRARAVDHYLSLAATLGGKAGRPEGSDAIRRLAPETANLDAMLLQGLDRATPQLALAAACALAGFIRFSGLGSPAVLEHARVVARKTNDEQSEADCISSLGDIALARSDHDAARARYEEALPLFRRVGAVLGEANCIKSLGDIALARSDHDAARARYEEALPLYRRVGAVLGEANCIQSLGDIALERSDHDAARARYEEALPLFRRVGAVLGEANCIKRLGDIALARSDHDAARARYEEALPLYRRVGDVLGEANCIFRLGDIALQRSDHDAARARYEEALPLFRRVGAVLGEANCIQSLGDIALRRSDHDAARARYEEALPLFRRVGAVLGEANCIQSLGDIALRRSDHDAARARYEEALKLYERIAEPYSIGGTHLGLARIARTDDDRRRHARAVREAWERIHFDHLVEELRQEFGDDAGDEANGPPPPGPTP